MIRTSLFTWVAVFGLLAGCAPVPEGASAAEEELGRGRRSCAHGGRHGRRTPLVFDTDMDFDDAAALAYLCQQHEQGEIDLLAVTVSNNGAGMPGHAIRNARCILSACGLGHIPVADGANSGVHPAPPELQGAVDAVLEGALAGCSASTAPSAVSAPTLIANTIRNSQHRVTVLTTGSLTNLADALAIDHRGRPLRTNIEEVVVMGGALLVPGNLLGSGVEAFDGTQELNIWLDPRSAEDVFTELEGKVSVIPLDATDYVPVTYEFVDRLGADITTPEAQIVHSIVTQPITQYGIGLGAFYWWDPLAAMVASGHENIVEFERQRISVVQSGAASGRLVYETRGNRGNRMSVGMWADQQEFEDLFLDGLNGR